MLKFRTKKKSRVPKFSILLWIFSLIVMLYLHFIPTSKAWVYEFAVRPSLFWTLINQSNLYIFELFSSLLIHADWKHWFGNMIVFAIIAPSLERRMGALWFVAIFFLSGFLGNLYSVFVLAESNLYLLGASGAVSGLLGSWLMLYPGHQIQIIIPIGLYLQKAEIPIIIIILIWLILQFLFQYIGSLEHPVVWGAHIVGFLAGFLLSFLYRIMD